MPGRCAALLGLLVAGVGAAPVVLGEQAEEQRAAVRSSAPSEETSDPAGGIVSLSGVGAIRLAGAVASFAVELEITEGYRVQANPASRPFLIPLEIVWEPLEDLDVGSIRYPEGEPYRLEGADHDLSTYRGRARLEIPVSVTEGASPGERTVRGTLRYQACNSKRCFFPVTRPIEVEILVDAGP